ncbi:aminoacyl-tRNA hydrolase [bacterium Unc6]|nr:aminoacyl-tRNA hydrolase [bacterium Unc6]
MHCIVGLGNPEEKYQDTRHNLGYNVVVFLAKQHNKKFRKFYNSKICEIIVDGKKTLLVLPLTFMNKSGVAVYEIIKNKHICLDNLLIVLDDISLPAGQVRIRKRGSAGGHKGLQSIIHYLRTNEFPRLRIGIGPKPTGISLEKFVLLHMGKQDIKKIEVILKESVDVCEFWVKNGTDETMHKYN